MTSQALAETSSPATASAPRPAPRRPSGWWPLLRRVLTAAFFLLLAWLLVRQARAVDWQAVAAAVSALPAAALAGAAALAVGSHLLYSCFDLLGRHQTGHRLAVPRVMAVNFVSYAFNLNFGSLVGGVALRYRLYSRAGLDNGVITEVLTVSMLTNWLGYLLLAGVAFVWRPLELPASWPLDGADLRLLGAALLAVPLAWLVVCSTARRRSWTLRGHTVQLPSLRMAGLQLLLSSVNWLLIAGTVYLLLQQQVPFVLVLSVLLAAAVAGVITHVPAGLGVLEAVFVTLLAQRVAEAELLAALLAYRGLYYLAPLAVACVLFLVLERKTPAAAQAAG